MNFQELLFGEENEKRKAELGFNSFGLKYSAGHLNSIRNKIGKYPVEEMAKYADFVTVNNIDKDWLIEIVNSKGDRYTKNEIKSLNATAIGNIAYFSLYSKDERTKAISNSILLKIKNYLG